MVATEKPDTGSAVAVIPYTVRHILILRLMICYRFRSARTLHNLLFLVSAETMEKLDLGFYDFVRTRQGAYSMELHQIIRELVHEKLISDDKFVITDKGRHIYKTLGAAMNPFSNLWNLCLNIIERYDGDTDNLNQVVFSHLVFRRARPGCRIYCNFG